MEPRNYRADVIEKTVGMLGSFLDEVSRNTSNYKSVHNLTEQIEHQYAGRFAIELIQNAHDPIRPEPEWNGGHRRVELMLDDSGPHGTLLVANDGRPFRPKDFESLASLGQSSKDPREAIGNKGIGFRSVLEVSRTPEIYSCQPGSPGSFSGYCFRFDPAVLDSFEAVVDRLLIGNDDAVWMYDGIEERVEGVRRAQIAARDCAEFDVRREVRFLSPYSLPLPASPRDARVRELAVRGFATVVRLPLNDAVARTKVENALGAISEETILFLPLVRSLAIHAKGGTRTYRRHEEVVRGSPLRRAVVTIEREEAGLEHEPRRFWLWRKTYGAIPETAAADDPGRAERARLVKAVEELPGNWKELREAEIAIGVELASRPRPGFFFIHLPTLQQTGVGAHLHAPFYGDMSRKAIDFKEEPVNAVLLGALASLAQQVLVHELIGNGSEEGAAALDLTARQAEGDVSTPWRSALRATGAMGLRLYQTDRGWLDAGQARTIAAKSDAKVLTRPTLRASAAFAALSDSLSSRELLALSQIRETVYLGGEPTGEERAKTVEGVARGMQVRGDGDWNAFLSDVMAWVPSAEQVAHVAILPDDQGSLHAARARPGGAQLFLPPVRGEGSREVLDVPESLRNRIAFVSPGIAIRDPGPPVKLTDLGSWLQKIVADYGAEPILSRVLIPALPEKPPGPNAEEGSRCREILSWAVQVVQRAGSEVSLLPTMKKLLVPCRGGWFRMDEAIAGPGWSELGALLDRALSDLDTPEVSWVKARLMLSPDDANWGTAARFVDERRAFLGIRDGLCPIEPLTAWETTFRMSSGTPVILPPEGPVGTSPAQWNAYAAFARTAFSGEYSGPQHSYQLRRTLVLPGLDAVERHPPAVRRNYAELVVRSIPRWADGWQFAECHKTKGNHHPPVRSWLAHTLTEWPWIWVDDDSEVGGAPHRPRELWYVPQLRSHNLFQYEHLNPIPPKLAQATDESSAGNALAQIGLRRCPIDDDRDSVRNMDGSLLDTLATAYEEGRVEGAALSIFKGQVRKAWRWFNPATTLPRRLVVQLGGALRVVKAGAAEVFLPGGSSSLSLLGIEGELQVLVIENKDAADLGPSLTAALPNAIVPLNAIRLEVETDAGKWVPAATAPRLEETDLRWLAPTALAVAAFAGQARGTGSKAFRQAVATIRSVRIEQAPGLAVRLIRQEVVGSPRPCAAHLDPGSAAQGKAATLLYDPQTVEVDGYAGFVRPLEVLLNRDDLRIQLLWVLERLSGADDPGDRETILSALGALEIDESRFLEVELALLGDLAGMIRRLMPVVQMLAAASAAVRFARAQTHEEIEAALDGLHPALSVPVLVDQARSTSNDRDMGLWLNGVIGADAELEHWNAALGKLGPEYRPVSNLKVLREELEEYRRDVGVALRSLARSVSVDGSDYLRLREAVDQVQVDEALGLKRWSLCFRDAASILVGPLASRVPPKLLAALADASDPNRFVAVLDAEGLEPSMDPAEIDGENTRLCRSVLKDVARIAIVWCGRRKLGIGAWGDVEALAEPVVQAVRLGRGYLEGLDEPRAFIEVRRLLPRGTTLVTTGPHGAFWEALDGVSSLAALLERLEISADELAGAADVLRRQEDEARRRRRLVKIAGAEFDTASENLSALFDHITAGTAPASPLDMLEVSELLALGKRRKPGSSSTRGTGGGPRPRGHRPQYRSQEAKDAIALAGEIHAYLWLHATYGSVVTPASWISSLSLHKFPSNSVDDRAGCDFRIKLPGRETLLHLEVKATDGRREEFELGVTEVALATVVLKKRRRRKEVFRILHVLDVFSQEPTPVLLPNPYEEGQNVIELAPTGVYMSYRRPKRSS